jgi:hypothetical protein
MRHGHGALYLEMKTPTGAVSPAQRELHALLTAQGYRVVVPRTFDQAVAAITLYLSVNITTALTRKQHVHTNQSAPKPGPVLRSR